MNFRTTIVVGILLVLIGAYAYFYEYKGGEKRKEQEEKSKTLVEIKKEDVASLKLESGGQTIEIKPSGKDQWEIAAPLKGRADDSTVGRVLGSLEKVKYKGIVDEKPSDLAQYELDHPKTRVRVALKSGKEKTISIGARNPVEGIHYVMIGGDPRVYSLEGDLADSAGTSLFDLRDKKLTDFSSDKVESLSVHTQKLDLQFKKETGSWKMLQPVASPASDSEVNSMLSTLEFLRATAFIDQPSSDLKTYGLAEPVATIEVALEKGLRQKISFGSKDGSDIYCSVEGNPAVAKVNDAFTAAFDKPLGDWREKKMVVFNRFDVEELRIKSEGKEYLFKKGKEEKWTQESPAKGDVEEDKVQGLMEKLENAEIDHYGDAASLTGAPVMEVWLTLKDWQNTLTKKHVAFGATDGNLQSIKNDDYSSVVFVNGATQTGIAKDLGEIKPPKK